MGLVKTEHADSVQCRKRRLETLQGGEFKVKYRGQCSAGRGVFECREGSAGELSGGGAGGKAGGEA